MDCENCIEKPAVCSCSCEDIKLCQECFEEHTISFPSNLHSAVKITDFYEEYDTEEDLSSLQHHISEKISLVSEDKSRLLHLKNELLKKIDYLDNPEKATDLLLELLNQIKIPIDFPLLEPCLYEIQKNSVVRITIPQNHRKEIEIPPLKYINCVLPLPDNSIVLTGTSVKNQMQMLMVDLDEYKHSSLQSFPQLILEHSAVYYDRKIYIIGGVDADGFLLDSVLSFDWEGKVWKNEGNLVYKRANCGVCVHKGLLYVGGGSFCTSLEYLYMGSFRELRINLTLNGACVLSSFHDLLFVFVGTTAYRLEEKNLEENKLVENRLEEHRLVLQYSNSEKCSGAVGYSDKLYVNKAGTLRSYRLENGDLA